MNAPGEFVATVETVPFDSPVAIVGGVDDGGVAPSVKTVTVTSVGEDGRAVPMVTTESETVNKLGDRAS